MASDESFFKMYCAFMKRTNYKEMFTAMLNDLQCSGVKLVDSVRSCLSIGPGGGDYEIAFMKHCAPNISKFLAVEPDHESVEHLRTSLMTSLPGVESQVFETTLQNWEGPSDPVDLILMFHCLYHVGADERPELFKKMHDRWLTSGGYVAVIQEACTESSKIEMIFERLGKPSPPWIDIEADLQEARFTKLYARELQLKCDQTNPDESLLRFYQRSGSGGFFVTLDYIRDLLKELYPDGQTDFVNMMAIFRKTD